MISFLSPSFSPACSYSSSLLFLSNPGCDFLRLTPKPKIYYTRTRAKPHLPIIKSSSNTTKLVTFLGKGGSGKTTASVFAAQHYAMAGLRTCLVIQTQDPTANFLLNCKIGTSPTICNDNLSAVRLETTKLLLEPLDRLKQADARLKLTQGVLDGVVGEELGVLPAMDSIFGAFVLVRHIGLLRNVARDKNEGGFDVVIYDGMSTDETLRMLGAASKARLYLKYLRNLAEKTDLGRVVGPSLLGLVDEAMNLNGSGSYGRMSSDVWDTLEKMLEKGSSVFYDPGQFSCFVVMDPNNPISVESALRYWGCTIQAGAQVSGAIGIGSPHLDNASDEVRKKFSALPFALIPHLAIGHPLDWNLVMLDAASQDAKAFFASPWGSFGDVISPVKFDVAKRSITLFMPGFDKSEIKLYQYRGGSELLVEAGDQRRVICLPQRVQGKVAGAKFSDRSLLITMR